MSLFRKKSIDEHMLADAQRAGLKKTLGALDLTFLGVGAIIGTGIFVLTGTGAVQAGPALMVSFILAAIACGLATLAYAAFASTIPVAGSIYTYSYATLGELAAGYRLGSDAGIRAGDVGGVGRLVGLSAVAAVDRYQGIGAREQRDGRDRADGDWRWRVPRHARELASVHAEWLERRIQCGSRDVLCVYRLRLGVDGGRRSEES